MSLIISAMGSWVVMLSHSVIIFISLKFHDEVIMFY